MRILLLLAILFSPPALAEVMPDCGELDIQPVIPEPIRALAEKASQKLPYHPAYEKEVLSAHCVRKNRYTDAEIDQEIAALFPPDGQPRNSANVFGVELKNEDPRLVRTLERLLEYQGINGFVTEAAKKQNQKAFKSSCDKVICAVKEIFGDRIGPRLVFMLGRYSMNGSHVAFENSGPWKIDEIDDVLLSLTDLPPQFFPVDEGKQLTHRPRGFKDGNTTADSLISIFDQWSAYPSGRRRTALIHELGHVFAWKKNRLDESNKWLELSGWSIVGQGEDARLKLVHPELATSGYSKEEPAEDFAESVSAYRYNPKLLLSINPEKYNFLRDTMFNGIEYTSEAACQPSNSYTARIERHVAAKITQGALEAPGVLDRITEAAKQKCGLEILRNIGTPETEQSVSACSARGVNIVLAEDSKEMMALTHPEFSVPIIESVLRSSDPRAVRRSEPVIKASIRKNVVRLLEELEKSVSYYYGSKKVTPNNLNDFCKDTYGLYAYGAAKNSEFFPKFGVDQTSYDAYKISASIADRACHLAHDGKGNINALTAEEIHSVASKLIP